jgi:hypothetical protein
MKGMAELSYPGSWALLPAQTREELHSLEERLCLIVRRHGTMSLRLKEKEWLVETQDAETTTSCVKCHVPLVGISYSQSGEPSCGSCAMTGW